MTTRQPPAKRSLAYRVVFFLWWGAVWTFGLIAFVTCVDFFAR